METPFLNPEEVATLAKSRKQNVKKQAAIGKKLEQAGGWWAGPLFYCGMRKAANEAILAEVAAAGKDLDADKKIQDLEFSLFKGTFECPGVRRVELEYTDAPEEHRNHKYDLETSAQLIKEADDRLEALYAPVVPVGIAIYALCIGGGLISGYASSCADGPNPASFAFPAIAVIIQVFTVEKLTRLISQTEVEGRPLLRMIHNQTGMDSYRVVVFMTMLDVLGRFTRAQFVGYMYSCGQALNEPFVETVEQSSMAFLSPVAKAFGMAGLSVASFIIGPIIIQFSYMIWLRRKLLHELRTNEEVKPGNKMDVVDTLDDLGALMQWATLTAPGKIFDLASLPPVLRTQKDFERLWDRMTTQVAVIFARNLPDGIMQMALQAWFLCMVFPAIKNDFATLGQMLMNIGLAAIGIIGDSADLITQNRRLTVLVGGFQLIMTILVFKRVIGCWVCASAVMDVGSFSCIPDDLVRRGNWTGILPG